MPKVNCAAIGCTNSTYQLNKWTLESFDAHHHLGLCITKRNCKDCEKPFGLYCFPNILKNGEKRKLWIKALKRKKQGQDSLTVWK